MADWFCDPGRLERSILRAIAEHFEPSELLPMVERLARIAPPGSPPWAFAHCKLAELLLNTHPWRAAATARLVARKHPSNDLAWGLLGLALTVLGHYRSAARAYREALRLAPEDPWYAHNLGHLLDVPLNNPREAVYWLRIAFRAEPHVEIAASLAQALGHIGRAKEGLRVLRRGLRGEPGSTEHQALEAWLVERIPTTPKGGRPGP
ncbi:MAG: hypothetical protein RMJ98_11460 [Myxococcales bacterium]|nr:hypothetical protein [Polyangiaceae bacterium]MDW8249905.1 hypothetical protein [Myxococcales bacterium]